MHIFGFFAVVRVRHSETVFWGAEQSPAVLMSAKGPGRSGHLVAPGLLAAAGHVGDGDVETARQTDTVMPSGGGNAWFQQDRGTAIVSTILQALGPSGQGG